MSDTLGPVHGTLVPKLGFAASAGQPRTFRAALNQNFWSMLLALDDSILSYYDYITMITIICEHIRLHNVYMDMYIYIYTYVMCVSVCYLHTLKAFACATRLQDHF